MKAVRKMTAAKGLAMQEIPIPTLGPQDALIKIDAAGICGTDYHIYSWDKWSQNRIKPPLTLGHEFIGTVAKVGEEVHHITPGDRVSGEGHIVCGHCNFCRTGQAHICQTVEIIGVDREGCFAEYLAMPVDNLWPVPDEIPDKFASIYDPIGNAMHTVMSAHISGTSVLIMGAGAIGLFAVSIAKAAGASLVIVIEPNSYKSDLAKKGGADIVLNPMTDDVETAVMNATHKIGPEVILEMSGNPKAMKQAFQLLRKGGEICLLGLPSGDVPVDWSEEIIFKGITIHGITGRRMYDTWYQTHEFLLHHRDLIDAAVTHVLPFDQFQKGFDLMEKGDCGKVVLTF
jgi:threonine 3-dehydrogenase